MSLAQTLSLVKLSPEFFFCQCRLTLLNACYGSRYYAWLGTTACLSSVRPRDAYTLQGFNNDIRDQLAHRIQTLL